MHTAHKSLVILAIDTWVC